MGGGGSRPQPTDDELAGADDAPAGAKKAQGDEPLFDKVLVRLEHGCVPKMDVLGAADTYVKAELVDTHDFPAEVFGCKVLEDRSDVRPLFEHRFSTKAKTLRPLWYEEGVFLAYRPKGAEPKGKLVIDAWDSDGVGKDDPLVTRFEVNFAGKPRGVWHPVKVPINAVSSADASHFLMMSVYLEPAETRVVSREQFLAGALEQKVITLEKGDLSGGGRAVLLWKTKPENTKAFFWLPGLNASFHHMHIMETLLAAGWDLYTLDCRRMGQAKKYAPPDWNPLEAHTTADLGEYCEEIDALVAHADTVKPGKYTKRVLYGNSTGSLTAVTYMHRGAHAKKVDGLAVNGPFFNWHLAAYAETLMSSALLTDIYAKLAVPGGGRYVAEGTGVSPYSLVTWAQYYYDVQQSTAPGDGGYLVPGQRSIPALHTTAEWCKAVTAAQTALKKGTPLLIPIFVISSASDTWVSSEEVLATSDFLGPLRTEVQVPCAAHDVFLSTTRDKVKESEQYMMVWLRAHFGA